MGRQAGRADEVVDGAKLKDGILSVKYHREIPESKKDELIEPSKEVLDLVQPHWMCDYDQTQAIGRRYRRQDEIGTPYCVTIDFETLEDKAVTVRERDSMEQDRVPIKELVEYLSSRLIP